MTDSLWKKAMKKSEMLQKHLHSEQFQEELERITGSSAISYLSSESQDNRGFLSIWLSMASLRERVSSTEQKVEYFDEDIEYLYNKIRDLESQIEKLNEDIYDERAETAEYIRDMTDRKYEAYQKLLEVQRTDTTQKEVAEELDMDEAVLSRFKKDFQQNNVL